jgi:hypothetical protein
MVLKWIAIRTYTGAALAIKWFDIPFRTGIEECDFITVYQNIQHADDDI